MKMKILCQIVKIFHWDQGQDDINNSLLIKYHDIFFEKIYLYAEID